MTYLPSDEEQDWLLGRLAALIARRGYESFVTAPILEPTDQYFPDAISLDARGVYILARRLLRYAGLGELEVQVELFSEGTIADAAGGTSHHRAPAAWFAGIEDGRCSFGVNIDLLRDAQRLPAAIAHEVAHAFRAQPDIRSTDVDEEELLTDLTTVYLGFGVLTTNASYQYRSSGELDGLYAVTRWSHQSLGYLPPGAMSFILAAQATARGLSSGEQRRIASLLESNQAADFRSAVKQLARTREELMRRLAIPAREEWPPPHRLADLLRPIENVPHAYDLAEAPLRLDPDPRKVNLGRKIFRVRGTRASNGALLGGLIGTLVAAVVARLLGSWLPIALVPVGFLAGLLRGRWIRADHCSEPGCRWLIAPDDSLCPGCGGTVSGEIVFPEDRFDAEENLRRLERNRVKGAKAKSEEKRVSGSL